MKDNMFGKAYYTGNQSREMIHRGTDECSLAYGHVMRKMSVSSTERQIQMNCYEGYHKYGYEYWHPMEPHVNEYMNWRIFKRNEHR